jgi:carbon storage regulator
MRFLVSIFNGVNAMLVLSRKENERLVIAESIVVQIIRVSGGTVRLGIEAPMEVPIRREELVPRMPKHVVDLGGLVARRMK